MKTPKLIIVVNNLTFRQRLIYLINVGKSVEIIGEASTGNEFLMLLSKHYPDLILMDVDIPRLNALSLIQYAKNKFPGIKIIAFTLFEDDNYIIDLIKAGVKKFILKSSAIYELDKDIHSLLTKANYCVDNQVVNSLLNASVSKLYISREHKRISTRARRFNTINYPVTNF